VTVDHRPPNRIYHGLAETDDDNGHRIVAEVGGGGPTERTQARFQYELVNTYGYRGRRTFLWGYGGSNPHDTAQILLADALGVEAPRDLVVEFVHDFVAHWHKDQEWWLPRWTILRWVKGWGVENGIDILPGDAVLRQRS
jgi:hypothetical protein